MIIEVVIGSITAIVVSSLIFARSVIKLQRRWEVEDGAPDPPTPPPKPQPVIYPFVRVEVGAPCSKCLSPSKNPTYGIEGGYKIMLNGPEGMSFPQACKNKDCEAREFPHLHVSCYTCNAHWFMAPADSGEAQKAKVREEEKVCVAKDASNKLEVII